MPPYHSRTVISYPAPCVRSGDVRHRVETQGAILDELSSLVDSGRIRTHMHDCVSWKEYAAAFEVLEKRKTIGKVGQQTQQQTSAVGKLRRTDSLHHALCRLSLACRLCSLSSAPRSS